MCICKTLTRVSLPVALLLVPFAAAYADRPGIYLGASGGAYRIDESNLSDNDNLVKGFVGGQFNPWFGIEGQWTDFNRLDKGGSRFDADGKGLAAVISFPFSDTSSIFIKGGEFWWDSDSSLGAT